MEHIDSVYYINLAHRADRNEHFLQEIVKLTDRATRVDAIAHTWGAFGCALSHCKALELFLASDARACIVFEDDFAFRAADPAANQAAMRAAFEAHPDWDVYLMAAGSADFSAVATGVAGVLRVASAQTTAGYCVARKFAPALLANFRAAAADMAARGPCHGNVIDQSWKALQPAHTWLVGAPPLGYQYGSFSDIEKQFCDYGC
ncbi:MAG: hypothetical protein EBU46_10510 [Nitrosomonadaceae bacterium]|nr:hypothetical protein [Nitrosomonadaceae bacterium]